jgi:general secretion pathway protein D
MMATTTFRRSAILRASVALAVLALAGCAVPQGMVPRPLYSIPDASGNDAQQKAASQSSGLQVTTPPTPPAPTRLSSVKRSPDVPTKENADITLSFNQISIPAFIQVTFGSILKKNYTVDPQIAQRTDLVTLRTSAPQTPTEVLATARMLLKTYGIAVTELGGFYRIAPDKDQSAYAPEIRRGRAQPDVPLPLRPVYNLVELTSVKTGDVVSVLKSLFGTKLSIVDDANIGSILISGQPTDVTAALEAIQVLDQPLMRGRSSRRIVPNSLSVEELAKKLNEILAAEGYAVTNNVAQGQAPIVLIPAPTSNSLLVFAGDQSVLNHVVDWARQLDSADNNSRRNGTYFTYPVKYGDAQNLAKTMQDILGSSATASAPNGTTGTTPTATRGPSKIVVDSSTNTLIFVSTQDQYLQLLDILKELDQPSKSALIEVTVAEVDITDNNSLGIQWALNGGAITTNTSSTGSTTSTTTVGTGVAGTSANLGVTNGGLTVNYLSGTGKVAATISALSSLTNVKVLSTPRLMTRNGESATIEVGDQVPIITSQLSNANTQVAGTTGANAGILQTVQYLPTGVILHVKPVSIRDGSTVLLGGLMQTSDTKGNAGIPLLKDIPVLGQLFRTNTDNVVKTELIVLITPYIIDDDQVAEQVTEAFRDELGTWSKQAPGEVPKAKFVKPLPVTPPMTAPATPDVPPQVPAPQSPQSQNTEPLIPEGSDTPAAAPDANAAPTVKKVTDPGLLEELRKAAAKNNPNAAGNGATPPNKNGSNSN